MKYHIFLPVSILSRRAGLSERAISERAMISRSCLRHVYAGASSVSLESIEKVADFFGRRVEVLVSPEDTFSEFSVLATAYKIQRDGFDSWKIHVMDLVDEFNRSLDPRLLILAPPAGFNTQLNALLSSITRFLCERARMSAPAWSMKKFYLEKPWFVSGIESLKASALIESPIAFRQNNIFVLENFLDRA